MKLRPCVCDRGTSFAGNFSTATLHNFVENFPNLYDHKCNKIIFGDSKCNAVDVTRASTKNKPDSHGKQWNALCNE